MARFALFVNGEKVTNEVYGSLLKAEKILLFCHGFPGTNRLIKLESAFKKERVAIIKINYRGGKKSGGKFSLLGSINDIKKTAIYLKNKYKSKKLYALGYSMGGFYLANILRESSKVFDKAILLNAVVNTQSLFSKKILMKKLWRVAGKILSLKPFSFYEQEIEVVNKKFNPIHFAHKLKTPIDVIQSTNDEVISSRDAKKFFSLLNCRKEFFKIPGADHDVFGNEEQIIKSVCN